MAIKDVYTFKSADGVSDIHAVKWMPDNGEVKVVLQITHGMIEYIERYAEFAEFLCDKGFAVYGHDHIGHGESVTSEEEWGIMHTDDPSGVMVEDILTNYNIVEKEQPGVPHFMLGHSMGSYMLRKFLSLKADEISSLKGAIIMGTGTEDDGTIKLGLTVLKVIAKFKGWDHRSKFVAGLMYGASYKGFDTMGEGDHATSWLNTNTPMVDAYYKDPKCTYMFSLNGYRGLVQACQFDNKQDNVNKMRKDCPLLVTSGANDPVGGISEGVKAAYSKFEEAGINDLTLKLYDGMRHEILNEVDRETVYNDIYDWITSKL